MWCFPDLSFFKYEIVTSVVLFRPPFYFVFDISNLLSYIQNNFSYELARPIMGTIFLVIIIIIIIIIIHFFVRVFSECTEVVATSLIPLVTNFPEICAFIIGFSFTVRTKSPRKKYRNK